jgi:hypothetical protein
MGFQKTVLIIALVILTFSIIFIATVISKNEANKQWPPETATCPPYYIVTKDNTCERDPNAPKIGTTNSQCDTFNLKSSSGIKSDRDKCLWANECKIHWDGVSAVDCNDRSALPGVNPLV